MRPDSEEYLNHLDYAIKEKGRGGFQEEVTNEFARSNYLVYHTWDSRNSPKGFPDVVLAGGARVIAIELKTGYNKPTDEQIAWLSAFRTSGALTFCLWPRHRTVVQRLADGKWFNNPAIYRRLHVYTKHKE